MHALVNNRWFATIPPERQQLLLSTGRVITLGNGELLHQKGDPPAGFYGIQEGKLKVGHVTADGIERVVAILEAGNWFGEISTIDHSPRTHDASSIGISSIFHIRQTALDNLFAQHPALYADFSRLLCMRVRATFQFIDSANTLTLAQQVAHRLCMLLNGFGQSASNQSANEISVSQESLAQMLNTSRQTVNQILQALRKRGIIELRYGRINVTALPELMAIAKGSE